MTKSSENFIVLHFLEQIFENFSKVANKQWYYGIVSYVPLKIYGLLPQGSQNGCACCAPYWTDICMYLLNCRLAVLQLIILGLRGDRSPFQVEKDTMFSAILDFTLFDWFNCSSHGAL